MHCRACDVILDDTELTKKDVNGNFLDMCSTCLIAGSYTGIDNDTFVTNYPNEVFTNDDDYGTLF